jgi:hypothetical protein
MREWDAEIVEQIPDERMARGYGWVISKLALEYSPPLTFAAIYLPVSAGLLFLVLAVARRSLRPQPLAYTAVIGLLQTTRFVGLAIVALANGGAAKCRCLDTPCRSGCRALALGRGRGFGRDDAQQGPAGEIEVLGARLAGGHHPLQHPPAEQHGAA